MFLDVDEESKDNNKYYLLLPDYYRLQIIKVLQVKIQVTQKQRLDRLMVGLIFVSFTK